MPSFRHRIHTPEMLDAADIAPALLHQNLRELNFINTWLGGHGITRKGFDFFERKKTVPSVCEIGCGGGDNLVAIAQKARKHLALEGIDMKEDCISFARAQPALAQARFQICDYRLARFSEKPTLIFSSLFCHHFTNDALVAQLRWMYENSERGFFINDLHRHWLAYHSIKWLTSWFGKSVLVKNDAPLSVRRAFVRADWQKLLEQAGIKNAEIRWQWAFRWLIIVEK